MKKTKAYLKGSAALLLALSMVFAEGAPLTLMKAFVSYAAENIPEEADDPKTASDSDADSDTEKDDAGNTEGSESSGDGSNDEIEGSADDTLPGTGSVSSDVSSEENSAKDEKDDALNKDDQASALASDNTEIPDEDSWAAAYHDENTDFWYVVDPITSTYYGKGEMGEYMGALYSLPEDYTGNIADDLLTELSVEIEKDGEIEELTVPVNYIYGTVDKWSGSQTGSEEVIIPEYIDAVDIYAFNGWDALKTITISGSLEVADLSFQNDSSLETVIYGEGITELKGNMSFYGCDSLSEIILPDSLKRITGISLFSGLPIEEMELPEGLEEISQGLFSDSNLREIKLPKGITEIPLYAFDGCTQLERVTSDGVISEVGNYAFNDCSSLTEVPDLSGVTEVGNGTFKNCSKLETVKLGDLTRIGGEAFRNCQALSDLGDFDFSEVTEIGFYAFFSCYALKQDIELPSITTLGYGAFIYSGITGITIGEGLEELPKWVCWDCEELVHAELPSSLTDIGNGAFKECISLKNVTIGSPARDSLLTNIQGEAFDGCSALESVEIYSSKSDVTIDPSAFPEGISPEFKLLSIAEDEDDTIEAGGQSLKSAIASAEADGTLNVITIKKNIVLDETVYIKDGQNVELSSDGGPYTIIASDEFKGDKGLFAVNEGGSLTLSGDIIYNGKGIDKQDTGSIVTVHGSLLMEDGTTKNINISKAGSAAFRIEGSGSEFTMEGGTVTGCYIKGDSCAPIAVTGYGSFYLNDGYIENNETVRGTYRNAAGVLVDSSDVNIADGSETGAYFEMSGGYIRNNETATAPVFLYGTTSSANADNMAKALFVMTGGTISGNRATPPSGSQNVQMGSGGVAAEGKVRFELSKDGRIENNRNSGYGGAVTTFGNSSYDVYAEFIMNGGVIRGNRAASGGGIYIGSDGSQINEGLIEGNEATAHGGGIYVSYYPVVLNIKNALITGNKAATTGGGAWFCPTGEYTNIVTDGAAIFDNEAEGGPIGSAGDDLIVVYQKQSADQAQVVRIPERQLGGGKVTWYKDGAIYAAGASQYGTLDSVSNTFPRFTDEESGTIETRLEWNSGNEDKLSSIALKAITSEDSKKAAEKEARVIIKNNSADRGGGIGGNGAIYIGSEEGTDTEYKILIKKQWDEAFEEDKKKPVTVKVFLGGYEADEVRLDSDNNWSAELDQLPDIDSLNDAGISITESGDYDMSYQVHVDSDLHIITIDILNKLNEDPGGGDEDPDPDKPGGDEKPEDTDDKPGEEENPGDKPGTPGGSGGGGGGGSTGGGGSSIGQPGYAFEDNKAETSENEESEAAEEKEDNTPGYIPPHPEYNKLPIMGSEILGPGYVGDRKLTEADGTFSKAEDSTADGLADITEQEQTDEASSELLSRNIIPELAGLYAENNDLFGWLTVPGTGNGYPVMNDPDVPTYYWHHTFDREADEVGVPFTAPFCTPDSDNILIHGHNMNGTLQFGYIWNYQYLSFRAKHPVIDFKTLYDADGSYEIMAIFFAPVYPAEQTGVFKWYQYAGDMNKAQFEYYVQNVKALSLYDTGVTAEYGDKLVTLETCANSHDSTRLVVVARKKTV